MESSTRSIGPLPSQRPPKSLLRQTLTPADRSIITQYLLDAEKTVKEYQAEINRLKLAIMTLESKKNRLKERMTEYRSMLSPIHRMPNELLTQIFAVACERNTLSPTSLPPIIALSESCGRFRENILSTPSLWSSMTLSLAAWNQRYISSLRLESLAEMFIERAGACPFDLALDFQDIYDLDESLLRPLRTIIGNSSNWRSFKFTGSPDIIHHEAFQVIRGCLPKLQHVALLSGSHDIEHHAPLDIFSICPNLQSLSLYPEFARHDLFVPWQQLESIEFTFFYGRDILAFLSHFRRLKQMKIIRAGSLSEDPNEEPDTKHFSSTVQQLCVQADSVDEFMFPFRGLTLPQLSSLDIAVSSLIADDLFDDMLSWDDELVEGFLHRSSCSILSLSLRHIPISDQQTLSLLRQLPSVTTLYIEESCVPDYDRGCTTNRILTRGFLREISVTEHRDNFNDAQPLLPQLTSLTMIIHGGPLLDQEALMDMLTSRWQPGVDCLQSVSITLMGEPPSEELLASLQCFRDAGQHMQVSHKYLDSAESDSDSDDQS